MKFKEVVFDGRDIVGFWMPNIESGEEEFVSLEQIPVVDVSQLTKLEQGLYLKLGSTLYGELEQLADRYKTNPQEIVLGFVNDLISSDSGSDDHIGYAARRWFYANCIDGEFVK